MNHGFVCGTGFWAMVFGRRKSMYKTKNAPKTRKVEGARLIETKVMKTKAVPKQPKNPIMGRYPPQGGYVDSRIGTSHCLCVKIRATEYSTVLSATQQRVPVSTEPTPMGLRALRVAGLSAGASQELRYSINGELVDCPPDEQPVKNGDVIWWFGPGEVRGSLMGELIASEHFYGIQTTDAELRVVPSPEDEAWDQAEATAAAVISGGAPLSGVME